jgi:hypothetical protein
MALDGVLADRQHLGDLPARVPLGDQLHDLGLTRAQVLAVVVGEHEPSESRHAAGRSAGMPSAQRTHAFGMNNRQNSET